VARKCAETSGTVRSNVEAVSPAGGPRQPRELLQRPVQVAARAWAHRLLAKLGWRMHFHGLPAKQGVIIVYPHTSNWDFPLGVLAKWAAGLQFAYWGKDSLFRIPLLGSYMRYLGGIPVDRSSPHGAVGAMVEAFRKAREEDRYFWLVLSPEGTRSLRPAWRSGFYHLAVQAQVPLGIAYIDYRLKQVGVETFVELSGDPSADLDFIRSCLRGRVGKRPELASPIQFSP
jgi:1-acyl-sn-glycerol-3-phosphate acyltransferase